eukprot:2659905-Pleurochrysis_carterae.AAC.3
MMRCCGLPAEPWAIALYTSFAVLCERGRALEPERVFECEDALERAIARWVPEVNHRPRQVDGAGESTGKSGKHE